MWDTMAQDTSNVRRCTVLRAAVAGTGAVTGLGAAGTATSIRVDSNTRTVSLSNSFIDALNG